MSSSESTEKKINDLHTAGYTQIDGIFVDIPIETSIRRTEARHREGYEEFCAGRSLGGRFVPAEVVRSQIDHSWGSQNRKTFENLKPKFDNWSLYDNSVDDYPAALVQSGSRDHTRP